MAMSLEQLDKVMVEVKRFVERAKVVKKTAARDPNMFYGCRETGDLKRASMDLSRALIELRKWN